MSTTGLQHEKSTEKFKMSQWVPVTEKIKESSLKGPSLLFSYVPLTHFEFLTCIRDAEFLLVARKFSENLGDNIVGIFAYRRRMVLRGKFNRGIFAFFVLTFFLGGIRIYAATVYKNGVTASYYADKFHGRKTSSGEIFNMYDYTAAHKTLPFGTLLRVTNLANGKYVTVKVNDRGPFVKGRELDVSKAAAVKLDMIKTGTAKVKIEILEKGDGGKKGTSGSTGSTASKSQGSSKASSQVKLESGAYYDIQLGAFSKKENAVNLAQKLLRAGFKNVAYQKTQTATRVSVTKVPAENVRQMQKELSAKGFTQQVVRKRKG